MFNKILGKKEKTIDDQPTQIKKFDHNVGRINVTFHFNEGKYDFAKSFLGRTISHHFHKKVKLYDAHEIFDEYLNIIRKSGYFRIDEKYEKYILIPFHCLTSMTYEREPYIIQGEYENVYTE